METILKFKVLRSIGRVYEESKDSKLVGSLFERVRPELVELSDYFGVPAIQAFFLAHIFALNYKDSAVDILDLGNYFDCNPMKILEYSDDLKELCDKGILKMTKSNHRVKLAHSNDNYTIDESISEAIVNNMPMPEPKVESFSSIINLLEKIYDLGKECDEFQISTEELLSETINIIESNGNFPLIQKVRQLITNCLDSYLFLYLVWETITGTESISIGKTVDKILNKPSAKVNYVQSIITKQNELIKKGLIEIIEAWFFNDTKMKLTEFSINMLLDEGITILTKKAKKDNIVEPGNIGFKELFFNEEEEKHLKMLQDLLLQDNLKDIQNRLEQKNLPKGMTALFYGPPGTGKTESVYQIAKHAGREIMRVDISQTKSVWFGESEKVIKRVFTDYQEYSAQCELCPILLINEADAIISKRKEILNSNVTQTENAIQNIILEELENFKGILIATTNRVNNLDSAFERRFLFKVEFSKPDLQVKAKIWKSKLLNLKMVDCERLASDFDFSGGQIDNIIRKYEISGILSGKETGIDEIIEFCKKELLSNTNRIKIGFIKN
jgi:SpoVK/Ycf46/Vps4 family AAA+-type ATPase